MGRIKSWPTLILLTLCYGARLLLSGINVGCANNEVERWDSRDNHQLFSVP